jgi:hypothetical protein
MIYVNEDPEFSGRVRALLERVWKFNWWDMEAEEAVAGWCRLGRTDDVDVNFSPELHWLTRS